MISSAYQTMRKIILLIFSFLFLLFAPGRPPAAAQSETGYDLLAAVNAFRAGRGMGPFEINDSLMAAAQRHANWCAATGTHSHTGEGGSGPQDRAAAAGYVGYAVENFASGTSGLVNIAWTIQMWSSDDIHLGTMLSTAPHAGAGVASNGSETWYVLVVGRPTAFPPPTRPSAAQPGAAGAQASSVPAPAIPAAPVVAATPNADGAVIHVVQPGQTLWDIAVTYGVPLADLLALNYLAEDALLHPGDAILVRLGPGQSPPPPPTLPAVHVVRAGETLWDIALIYDIDLDDLRALNGLAAGAVIVPGMELRLRPPDATATATPPPTETPPPSPLPPTATPSAFAVAALPSASPTLAPTPSPTVPSSPAPGIGSPGESAGWAIFFGALGLALIVGTMGGGLALLVMRRRAAQAGPPHAPKR